MKAIVNLPKWVVRLFELEACYCDFEEELEDPITNYHRYPKELYNVEEVAINGREYIKYSYKDNIVWERKPLFNDWVSEPQDINFDEEIKFKAVDDEKK